MSLDNAAKRKSASGVMLPHLVVGITPNALSPSSWRQTAGWSYALSYVAPEGVVRWAGSTDSAPSWTGSSDEAPRMAGSTDASVSWVGN